MHQRHGLRSALVGWWHSGWRSVGTCDLNYIAGCVRGVESAMSLLSKCKRCRDGCSQSQGGYSSPPKLSRRDRRIAFLLQRKSLAKARTHIYAVVLLSRCTQIRPDRRLRTISLLAPPRPVITSATTIVHNTSHRLPKPQTFTR